MEKTYKGHAISLREHDFTFTIKGPEIADRGYIRSYRECEEAIDKAISARKQANKEKLSLPVLDKKGQRHIVTGIHGTESTLTGLKDATGTDVYPDVAWLIPALERWHRAEVEEKEARIIVQRYRISVSRGYSKRPGPERMLEMYEELKTEHRRATERAKEATPKEEVK